MNWKRVWMAAAASAGIATVAGMYLFSQPGSKDATIVTNTAIICTVVVVGFIAFCDTISDE
jgi:hypothetical protein